MTGTSLGPEEPLPPGSCAHFLVPCSQTSWRWRQLVLRGPGGQSPPCWLPAGPPGPVLTLFIQGSKPWHIPVFCNLSSCQGPCSSWPYPRDHLLCKAVISLLKNSFLVSLPQGCPLWEGRGNVCEGASLVPCLMLPGAGALASTMFLTRSHPHSLLCRGVTSVWGPGLLGSPLPFSSFASGPWGGAMWPTRSEPGSELPGHAPHPLLGEAAVVWLCSSGLDRCGK